MPRTALVIFISLFMSFFLLTLLSRNRRAGPELDGPPLEWDEQDEEDLEKRRKRREELEKRDFTMGYERMSRKGVQILFLFWPTMLALVCFVAPPGAVAWWLPYVAIGGALAILIPVGMEVFRHRVRVDGTGIHNIPAFGAPLSLAWQDISRVRVISPVELQIFSSRGERIRLPLFLSGFDSLARRMSQHLSRVPDIQSVCQRISADV